MKRLLFACALALLPSLPALAADDPWTHVFEVGAAFGSYSEPFGDADFQFASLTLEHPRVEIWRLEASRAHRFGDEGLGAAASYTRVLPAAFEIGVGASGGTGDFVYPDYQIDASIGRSFLPDRKLFGSVFYTHSQSKLENEFDRVGLSVEVRPDEHWLILASAWNEYGDPGDTTSRSGSLDLRYGTYRKRFFTIGAQAGSVSYLLVSPTTALIDYDRTEIHGGVQIYVTPKIGFNVRLLYEHNDLYDFRTAFLSFFKEW